MSGDLGDDLVMAILSKLPAKHLVKCKTLSKSFHNLISDFISRKKPMLPMSILLCPNLDFKNTAFVRIGYARMNPSPGKEEEEEERAVTNINKGMEHLPSCILQDYRNGLLLFFEITSTNYYICNPLTNKWFALPPFSDFHLYFNSVLAFDPHISHHYKVICFLITRTSDSLLGFQIFSSETGNWVRYKMFEQPRASYFTCYLSITAFLNGVVYVLSLNHVIGFTVEEERFWEIQLPEAVNKSFKRNLGVSGGFLHYCTHSHDNQFRIWVFNKYHNSVGEWILKKSIGLKSLTGRDDNDIEFRLVAIHPEFDIVFLEMFAKVYSFDFNSMRLEELYTFDCVMTRPYCYLELYPFSPCLYDDLPSKLPIGWKQQEEIQK
ncbi:F-box protein At5g07610-like [Tasmannia lanceolata]|uniref:F-box protein At5g07610-like n=1 Tax=Tasmannia lanceolata TaxID=3420 RepID=UPI004062A2F6